jgi:class 3 adenylate cyclase
MSAPVLLLSSPLYAALTKFTLRKKYSVAFSLIFLSVLLYIISIMFESEKNELIRLSEQSFTAVFKTVNVLGEEVMSVGSVDKLALKAVVRDVFDSKLEGLERIYFVGHDKHYFVYYDAQRHDKTDSLIPESVWASLEKEATESGSRHTEDNKIFLTKKIIYSTATKDVFLGYSQLVFSIEHVNDLISRKQTRAMWIGVIGFLASLALILLITTLLVSRIKLLNKATKDIATGQFSVVKVKGNDELSELANSFNDMSVAVKERMMMTKYMSSSLVNSIRGKNLSDIALGGGTKENICVLFSDVRGFTAFTEEREPQLVVAALNEILDLQVSIIKRFGGDIDKFIGDAVMAVFRGESKEERATAAAVAIQLEVKRRAALNTKLTALQIALQIGIGIHSGEAITGNIGSADRMDFTAIGDVVNSASRLCSGAKAGEVLISETVKESLAPDAALSEPVYMQFKNKRQPFTLYHLLYEKHPV